MSKQGQYNYSGINFQSWAAMSLFLQYLRDPNFSHIHLEAPEFQDFNLVFNNGRRIICEAKGWKRKLSFSNLKEILDAILKREKLGENDEILIICENLDERLKEKVRNIKYFKKFIIPYFKKKGFTKEQIELLSKVNFWQISREINQNIIYSLFSELLNFWIPEHDLKRIVDNILIQKIYKCSAKGATFTRTDFLTEIENLKKEVVKNSGYFDKERRKIEDNELLKELIEAIENNRSPVWADNQIAALSTQPHLMYFVLQKLQNKKNINIRNWGKLWEVNKVYAFSFDIFKIFENNLHIKDNRKYILEFIKKNTPDFKRFFRPDFFEIRIVKIVNKIIEQDETLLNEALGIIKELLRRYESEYFYLKTNRDSGWEKEEICKLIKEIYKRGDENLKNRIYELITGYFNLIEDDGEFSHYTPKFIFQTLENYLTEDWKQFEQKFLRISKILTKQYERFYEKFGRKIKFRGWEQIGGVTSFSGYDYKIPDRHFIRFVLKPALGKYYKEKPEKAWRFIMKNCITPVNRVSKNRPDFLNRASISIILERYRSKNKDISEEAFKILKEFILSRKGIPHKSELIYQELRGDFSDDEKWNLVKVSIDKYKLPINPFVEQIILDLAKKGHKKSIEIMRGWIRNPEYFRGGIPERNVIINISQLLDVSFDEGVAMFKDFIGGNHFLNELDNFYAFEVAGVLNKIINKNFNIGLELLKTLFQKSKLVPNEQILLCSSLTSKTGSRQENKEILIRIYKEFLDPFLNNLDNDIKKIEKKITRAQSREEIVQFADALAKHKKISEALRIVRVFINDSDPCTPEKVDPTDPEGKYDEHKKIEQGEDTHAITTVRGWCAWVLMNCSVLAGRDFLEEIIELTEKLTKDKNYYVRWMSCHPLSQLARNRLAVMPENREELFFNKDREKALKMAKRVEKIAFKFLERISELDPKPRDVLMKALLRVFDRMRGLNQNDASEFIKTVTDCGEEVIAQAAPLFIYFAEFRAKDFKEWKWQMLGLYDDLEEFNDKEFKQFLKRVMLKSSKTRSAFAWHFWKLVKESVPDKTDIKNIVKYGEAFGISNYYLNILVDDYDHQTFKNIYYFIQENIGKQFEECYKLWRKCLEKERPVIKKLIREGKIYEASWWPFYHNGEILMVVQQKGGNEEFLDSFEFLLGYPKEANVGDVGIVIEILQGLPSEFNKRIEKIFDKLIERNPNYYDTKEAWKKKING